MDGIKLTAVIIAVLFVSDTARSDSEASRARAPSESLRLYRLLKKRLVWAGEPDVRPVDRRKPVTATNLTVGMTLTEILELQSSPGSRSAALAALGWIKMEWSDPNLPWNPRTFGGLDTVRLPANMLWKPDIKLFNSRAPNAESCEDCLAVVFSTGLVYWIPMVKLHSTCYTDDGDNQDEWRCKWKFGSWTYSGDLLNLVKVTDVKKTFDLSYMSAESDWRVSNVTAAVNSRKYDCCQEEYQDITFQFVLSRNQD